MNGRRLVYWCVFALVMVGCVTSALAAPSKGRTLPATKEQIYFRQDLAALPLPSKRDVDAKEERLIEPTREKGWVVLHEEGFEGAFPGPWDVYDADGTTNGEYYWDDTSCNPHTGNWSGWCADGGVDGYYSCVNGVPTANYPNYLDSWLVYGPFDLSDADDAEVLFKHWTTTEADYDWFKTVASANGVDWGGWMYCGDWTAAADFPDGYCEDEFDLTDVPGWGNLCGETEVWIAFVFESNVSVTYRGTYLDDIVIRKDVCCDLSLNDWWFEQNGQIVGTSPNCLDRDQAAELHMIVQNWCPNEVLVDYLWIGTGIIRDELARYSPSVGRIAPYDVVEFVWAMTPTDVQGIFGGGGCLYDVEVGVEPVCVETYPSDNSLPGEVCVDGAKWTFMVYLAGDNNLEDVYITNFERMEDASSNSSLDIVVQFDRTPLSEPDGSSEYGDWTDCRRFHITPGVTPAPGNEEEILGECNMADPNVLADFVNWAKANYPADHYLLAIDNHGAGWEPTAREIVPTGIVWDDTDGDYMSTKELRSALNNITSAGTEKLDVVFLDACLMQMIEVGYEIKNYAHYLVASQYIGWAPGPYDDYMSGITLSTTAQQLAKDIVTNYDNDMGGGYAHTMSVVDLAQLGLAQKVDDFAQALMNDLSTYRSQIENVRAACQKLCHEEYIDLYHFADLIKSNINSPSIQNAAQDVMDAVNAAVIEEAHNNGSGSEPRYYPLDNAHGISIYFPPSGNHPTYPNYNDTNLAFVQDKGWDEFLEAFFTELLEWTVMIYVGGDCNLEEYAVDDLNEMEAAGSSGQVNVLAQIDRAPLLPDPQPGWYDDDTSNGDWTGCRRYYVTRDTNSDRTIRSQLMQDLGEVNMGDPQTLIDFATWAITNYPARRYALVLWDHGGGWKPLTRRLVPNYICIDDTDGDNLTTPDLRQAFQAISNHLGGRIDLVGFDACLMGMIELDYELQPYTEYRVASEEIEPLQGWDYTPPLEWLRSHPQGSPEEFAEQIVVAYGGHVANADTQSAVKLADVRSSTLASDVDQLASDLLADMETYRTAIANARSAVREYVDEDFVDLYHLAQLLHGGIPVAPIQADASAVMNAITAAVTANYGGVNDHGISIYFPDDCANYLSSYDTDVLLSQHTMWDDFLRVYCGQSGIDAMLILDRSGSMSSQRALTRLEQAKDAAKYFVSASVAGDQIGVAAYETSGTLVAPLTAIGSSDPNDPAKVSLRTAIDSITLGGMTNFGAGLQIAYDQLVASTSSNPKFAVLMSDGHHNTGSYTTQVQAFKTAGWPIYTVAFGSDADEVRLQEIADETGGLLFMASSHDLTQIYNLIMAHLKGQSVLAYLRGWIAQGQTVLRSVPPLGSEVESVRFTLSWSGSGLDLDLVKPDGSEITPADAVGNPDINYYKEATYLFYVINNPQPGNWGIKIHGTDVPPDQEEYTASVTVEGGVIANFRPFQAHYDLGEVVDVGLTLEDSSGPVVGASVDVTVTKPSGGLINLALLDDGSHQDGAANDGWYGGNFGGTDEDGLYEIRAEVTGTCSCTLVHTIVVGENTPPLGCWDQGTVQIQAQGSGTDTQNWFGVDPSGTECFDALDIPEPPPTPPPYTSLWFVLDPSCSDTGKYTKDIKPSIECNEVETWTMKVADEGGAQQVTLSWDTHEMPTGVCDGQLSRVILVDVVTGVSTDMRTASRYIYTKQSNPETREFTITVNCSTCQELCTDASPTGWHMITIPGDLCGPCADGYGYGNLCCAICDDLDPCFIFRYDPSAGEYVMVPPCDAIDYQAGMGFWVRTYTDPVNICADVTLKTEKTCIPLQTGWNQIGNPFNLDVALSNVTVRYGGNEVSLQQAQSNAWVSMYLFGYDTAAGGYGMLDPTNGQLKPWTGYWVRAYVDCEVCIPPIEAPPLPPSALLFPKDLGLTDISTPPLPPNLPKEVDGGVVSQLSVRNIPNPIRSQHTTTFKVEGKGAELVQAIRVGIYNQSGQKVFTQDINAKELDWHTDNDSGELLANGVYLYQVWVKIADTWYPTGIRKLAVYH